MEHIKILIILTCAVIVLIVFKQPGLKFSAAFIYFTMWFLYSIEGLFALRISLSLFLLLMFE